MGATSTIGKRYHTFLAFIITLDTLVVVIKIIIFALTALIYIETILCIYTLCALVTGINAFFTRIRAQAA